MIRAPAARSLKSPWFLLEGSVQECCDTAGLCQMNCRSLERKTRSRCLISTFRQKRWLCSTGYAICRHSWCTSCFFEGRKAGKISFNVYTASHEVIYLHLAVQNLNDRTMMKASRRVATVEEFYSILEQVHSKDCLHAGSKKTVAKVCTF